MFGSLPTSFLLLTLHTHLSGGRQHYDPTWDSLDKRVAPSWYDEAKFGIFMHWGVYSVPGLGEWFWQHWDAGYPPVVKFMKDNFPPSFKYSDFAPMFKADLFDPDFFADLVEASGARNWVHTVEYEAPYREDVIVQCVFSVGKQVRLCSVYVGFSEYFVITSKHHEGFTLWKSNVSWNWNSVDAGPHRDLLEDLASSVRNRTDVRFCLYHSLYEWFHPLYLLDRANNYTTQYYVQDVLLPQLYDMVLRFQPHYIFSDGDWDTSWDYWKSLEFIAWLYNDSPVRDEILVNDRWGAGSMCKHGDVKTCADRFQASTKLPFKWENAMTVDTNSWGYNRNSTIESYLTAEQLVETLAQTVSCGGNMVMNVGPGPDGTISPIFQERMMQMGSWLRVNGEAIYSTTPWRVQNDTSAMRTWYTSKNATVYAIVFDLPKQGPVMLYEPIITPYTSVHLLGYNGLLTWAPIQGKQGIQVDVSPLNEATLPCEWAWSFKLAAVL